MVQTVLKRNTLISISKLKEANGGTKKKIVMTKEGKFVVPVGLGREPLSNDVAYGSSGFTSSFRSKGLEGYMLAQWAVPLMKTAGRSLDRSSVIPKACQGSTEPLGKTMRVTFLGIFFPP